jgi:hypothetical protein
VFTLIAHNRGHSRVWLQSVKQTNFFAPPVTPPPDEKGGFPMMAAPQPQYQYPPNFGTPGPSSPPPQGMPYGQPMQQQPVYPLYAGSPVMQQQQQPMYPQHTGSPVMQQQQQPMYPQYAGSPVMQQNPGYGQV